MPCTDLDPCVAFFVELGFRLEQISPADDPSLAVLSGHGLRLRVERGGGSAAPSLRLIGEVARSLEGPCGTRVEVVLPEPPIALPPLAPAFVLSRAQAADGAWVVGRAGMRYRDLIPGRQGGRFIASHIMIPEPGPVPDAVHYHQVRFQLIACLRGWVRVVYEDQGPPFVLEPGDCVLQPPAIRHRVLESSGDLEVLELGCPAVHATCFDPDLTLPTPRRNPERVFSGQRFVRHVAREAGWSDAWRAGWRAQKTKIAAATGGLARVEVLRRDGAVPHDWAHHEGELLFGFVLQGSVTLARPGQEPVRLSANDAFVIPPRADHALREPERLHLLEVQVNA